MMRVKVTVSSMRGSPDAALRRLIRQKEVETAEEIASVAEQLAPKRTGALAKSIGVEESAEAVRVVVGKDYGKYPEYGTVHQAPQPYLRPAVNQGKRRIRARLGQIHKGLGDILKTTTRVQKG